MNDEKKHIKLNYVRRCARRLNRLIKLWCRGHSEIMDDVWQELFDMGQLLDEFDEITRKKMTKYRKKPIVISAEQWFPGSNVDGVFIEAGIAYIKTLDGTG